MDSDLDLSFLTPTEVEHLRSVIERAQKVEAAHREKEKCANNVSEATSNDIIQFEWKRKQNRVKAAGNDVYVPACEAVTAALNGHLTLSEQSREADKEADYLSSEQSSHFQKKTRKEQNSEDLASSSNVSSPIKFYRDESEFSESTSSSASSPVRLKKEKPLLIYTPPSSDNLYRENRPLFLKTRDKSFESSSITNSHDTTSMISRSTLRSREYAGSIDVTLTYFPPTAVRQKTFPSKGTRFPGNKKLDVLTRKTYASRSGAKIHITKSSKSGARSDKDGELHLFVTGANDLNLPRGARDGEKTYVKCYLLPDRYHGSKMKSETQKDTLSPNYNHKFVFRGFSESEFNERSIEIVIGGIASAHGRHLVVGGIRLSNGQQNTSGLVPWKDPNTDESSIWRRAFAQPSVETSSTVVLHPKIKLTYK